MRILFIGGSLNQTSMLHNISRHLKDHDCRFTPFYADGILRLLAEAGLLKRTILGGRHRQDTLHYLEENKLDIDHRGQEGGYDLVVTGTDGIIQKNIRKTRLILVQEGITTRENLGYHLVRLFNLPGWLANTAATGLSDTYDKFCVASEGYKKLFLEKGVVLEKIVVTGIPNFDNFEAIDHSGFPHTNYVLVATSPQWELHSRKKRKDFIEKCLQIAGDRELIFKLHPIENVVRAIDEINQIAPDSKVYWRGSVDEMIAGAEAVITHQSSCTYTAVALGKEVHTNLDLKEIKRLVPIQNKGTSAQKIARVCQQLLETPMPTIMENRLKYRKASFWETFKI